MSDLKVNAKTNILEFKRKHNKLVDSSTPKFTVSNIENLSDAELDELKAGDIVLKTTGNMKHTYIVTYKEEKHGICLSYFACGYLETISYDYTNGHWVFNSKDVCEIKNGLEVIEWDGERNFTAEEVEKLRNVKACVKYIYRFYYPRFDDNGYVELYRLELLDDGIVNVEWIDIYNDGTFMKDHSEYNIGVYPPQSQLYKHEISFSGSLSSHNGSCGVAPFYVISARPNSYSLSELDLSVGFNCIALNDDDSCLGSSIVYDNTLRILSIYDVIGQINTFDTISDFTDTVTAL